MAKFKIQDLTPFFEGTIAVRKDELDVVGLDCLDGTPLLDIKRAKFDEGSEAHQR